jgi:hypothetical protein
MATSKTQLISAVPTRTLTKRSTHPAQLLTLITLATTIEATRPRVAPIPSPLQSLGLIQAPRRRFKLFRRCSSRISHSTRELLDRHLHIMRSRSSSRSMTSTIPYSRRFKTVIWESVLLVLVDQEVCKVNLWGLDSSPFQVVLGSLILWSSSSSL